MTYEEGGEAAESKDEATNEPTTGKKRGFYLQPIIKGSLYLQPTEFCKSSSNPNNKIFFTSTPFRPILVLTDPNGKAK
jgi:hypothetical protein